VFLDGPAGCKGIVKSIAGALQTTVLKEFDRSDREYDGLRKIVDIGRDYGLDYFHMISLV